MKLSLVEFVGSARHDLQVAVRVNLGIDAKREVSMKLSVRSSDLATSELIHEIFTG